ncbi:MAG: DUF6448 family protein [Euryarchaeota archaeon]|jgi:hypothetical protein|nr:DUF6448 family protein [Euryarchaeota archaeon]
MPPHSESMDGPVVNAAEKALDMENVNYVLPFVPLEHEGELKEAFERTIIVRELSASAAELADYWFFETAVRLHLSGRGKPYHGIKPAGYNRRPALTLAEEALKKENSLDLINFMVSFMQEDIQTRFEDVLSKKDYELKDIESGRDYISSMQDFIRYLDKLYEFMEQG